MSGALDLDARIGASLGPDLQVERAIGQGRTARVYLARDVALDKPVTLKVLKPEIAAAAETRARFEREARTAANLAHPNLVGVHRYGVLPSGEPFLVMQYVRGRTLAQRLAAEGALAPADARRILCDVAQGLDAAHAAGVVHRDVRPDNILLDEENERALVTDFGLAALTEAWPRERGVRITATGEVLGDPQYVSPEQFRGEPVTDASDVYSLGLVAYEMLCGSIPHTDAGMREAAVARLNARPIEIPAELVHADAQLADVLARCLAPDPARRPRARTVARWLSTDPSAPLVPMQLLPERVHRVWQSLARRRLPQWVAGTTAGAWVLLNVVDQLIDRGRLPDILYDVALSSTIAVIPIAAVLAWYHGERGDQRVRPTEIVLLALILIGWLAALVAILAG